MPICTSALILENDLLSFSPSSICGARHVSGSFEPTEPESPADELCAAAAVLLGARGLLLWLLLLLELVVLLLVLLLLLLLVVAVQQQVVQNGPKRDTSVKKLGGSWPGGGRKPTWYRSLIPVFLL